MFHFAPLKKWLTVETHLSMSFAILERLPASECLRTERTMPMRFSKLGSVKEGLRNASCLRRDNFCGIVESERAGMIQSI